MKKSELLHALGSMCLICGLLIRSVHEINVVESGDQRNAMEADDTTSANVINGQNVEKMLAAVARMNGQLLR